jgi:protein SCO1/2
MSAAEHAAVMGGSAPAADLHAQHHARMPADAEIYRSVVDVAVPALSLIRDDGKSVLLTEELDDG